MYKEVLNKIADRYNPLFSLLTLPKALEIHEEDSTLVLPHYDGKTFNALWNEATGGLLLGLELSAEIPEVLHNLSKIDLAIVLANKELMGIPRLVFSTKEYLPEFDLIAQRLRGLVQDEEIERARKIIGIGASSPLMLNNADFYPRNFIRTPAQKLVLLDWDTWSSNCRANIVDHPENIAAFCFVHMWNNAAWQKNYVTETRKRFPMHIEDFQRAILIKSFEMANFWFGNDGENELCQRQLKVFRNAMDDDYMSDLWADSHEFHGAS